MAVRKVARDLSFARNLLLRQQLVPSNVYLVRRDFNDFSKKKIKFGETERTNQTNEQLYKNINAVWTEAEVKNVKDDFEMRKIDESKSPLSKMWEALKNKMRSHPVPESNPASVSKILVIAARLFSSKYTRRRNDLNSVAVLGEPELTMLYAEMQRRDPTFSHVEFYVLEQVQKVVKQVLTDHFKMAEEDIRKFTHHPGIILDKILFGEPDLVMLFNKMYPENEPRTFSSSLPEFHTEVEKVVKPTLSAHIKKQGVDATRVGEDHQILKGQTTMNQTLRDREVQEY